MKENVQKVMKYVVTSVCPPVKCKTIAVVIQSVFLKTFMINIGGLVMVHVYKNITCVVGSAMKVMKSVVLTANLLTKCRIIDLVIIRVIINTIMTEITGIAMGVAVT